MTETPGRPVADLSDEELERQGKQAHDTRNWVFLHGTATQFERHTTRMLELEQEYLRRHPQRTWQGSGAEGAPPPEPSADVPTASRIRDLVHTFVREIDYLLGSDEVVPPGPGPAEVRLLARIAAAPDGRLHKLEAHQVAREVGAQPRAVATLYKLDPPLLHADGDARVITAAGQAWLAEEPAR